MTVYSPRDVRAINPAGGCEHGHTAPDDHPHGVPMRVDCADCEPAILAARLGWSNDPATVALTCDEIAEAERAREQSARNQGLLFGELLEQVRAGGRAAAGQPASLLDVVKAASPEELAALRALLLAEQPAQPAGDGQTPLVAGEPEQPTADSPDTDTDSGEDAGPAAATLLAKGAKPARKPGRSKTAAA